MGGQACGSVVSTAIRPLPQHLTRFGSVAVIAHGISGCIARYGPPGITRGPTSLVQAPMPSRSSAGEPAHRTESRSSIAQMTSRSAAISSAENARSNGPLSSKQRTDAAPTGRPYIAQIIESVMAISRSDGSAPTALLYQCHRSYIGPSFRRFVVSIMASHSGNRRSHSTTPDGTRPHTNNRPRPSHGEDCSVVTDAKASRSSCQGGRRAHGSPHSRTSPFATEHPEYTYGRNTAPGSVTRVGP